MQIHNINYGVPGIVSDDYFHIKVTDTKILQLMKNHQIQQALSNANSSQTRKERKKNIQSNRELKANNGFLTYKTVNKIPHGTAHIQLPNNKSLEFNYSYGIVDGLAQLNTKKSILRFSFEQGIAQGSAHLISEFATALFTFVNGLPQGKAVKLLFNETRILFEYNNGVAEGYATEISEGNYQMQFTYKKGIPFGLATKTYINGTQEIQYLEMKSVKTELSEKMYTKDPQKPLPLEILNFPEGMDEESSIGTSN
jgi:hypothetical protein